MYRLLVCLIMIVYSTTTTGNNSMHPNNVMHTAISLWQDYIDSIDDWQQLIKNIPPKITGCGLVYDITNPIPADNTSFAIVDMRNLNVSEPHYHPEIEIYFVLQGVGIIVVGGQEQQLQKGSVIVIPSNIAHFVFPDKELIIAVVNMPPFNPDNYHALSSDNADTQFDHGQFEMLCTQYKIDRY